MRRIIFASPKGGSGKSTVCRNLAVAAAHDGMGTVTADLDPQATLTIWSRRRAKNLPAIPHFKVAWGDADALLDDGELEGHEALFVDTPPSIETQPAAFGMLLAFPERKRFGWGLLVYGVSVSIATIYGRYHYAADVLAGIEIGLVAGLLCLVLRSRRAEFVSHIYSIDTPAQS